MIIILGGMGLKSHTYNSKEVSSGLNKELEGVDIED
jgi:hypothetical protein